MQKTPRTELVAGSQKPSFLTRGQIRDEPALTAEITDENGLTLRRADRTSNMPTSEMLGQGQLRAHVFRARSIVPQRIPAIKTTAWSLSVVRVVLGRYAPKRAEWAVDPWIEAGISPIQYR